LALPSAAASAIEMQRPLPLHLPWPGQPSVWHAAPVKPAGHAHAPVFVLQLPTPEHSALTPCTSSVPPAP
jgi:hypothetical protein